MSLYNRRALLALPLVLAACGFTPVYAPSGSGNALQNSVAVVEQNNANNYMITRRIEERVGRASVPKYQLSLNIRTFSETLAVDSESNINRFNLIGEADYTLVEQATGRVVTSGSVDNFTGASATGTTVATLAARRDARERLMTLLADQIVVRLLSTDLT